MYTILNNSVKYDISQIGEPHPLGKIRYLHGVGIYIHIMALDTPACPNFNRLRRLTSSTLN
jgi:hypothetical protein